MRSDNARWYRRRILPYRTEDNRVEGLVVLFDDITVERELQAQNLKKSEQRLMAALKVGGSLVYAYDIGADDEISRENARCWGELLGYHEEITNFPAWLKNRLEAEDWRRMREAYGAFLLGESEGYQIELPARHEDGRWRRIRSAAIAAQYDEEGRVTRVIGVLSDITETKPPI